LNAAKQPSQTGGYFTVFNDGTPNDVECRLMAFTNGVASGHYRLGINNWGPNAMDGEMVPFPQDLVPGSNYIVVTALVLSNGVSTLWVNPNRGQYSSSVTDPITAKAAQTSLFNISNFELCQEDVEPWNQAGSFQVGRIKIGPTFDSVCPSPQVQPAGTNVVVTWSDPTMNIQVSTNVAGPYLSQINAISPFTTNLHSISGKGGLFFKLAPK